MLDDGKIKYFAAANTQKGFFSLFNDVFYTKDIEKRYIIKGGPGTGKSSFIRRVGLAAENDGQKVEYYYCSSDTRSLDGIVVDGKFAVLDGTAPHCCDTVLPGVRDEIINLGELWNAKLLGENRESIIALSAKKREAYDSAYSYLGATVGICERLGKLRREFCLCEKLSRAVSRLYSSLGLRVGTGNACIKQTSAFGIYGAERLDTLEKMAKTRYYVRDCYGIGTLFLEKMLELARADGVEVFISMETLDMSTPRELYFPERGVWLGVRETSKDEVRINSKRFADSERLADVRGEYREARRICDGLTALATEKLAVAGKAHAELEKYYVASMDFGAHSRLCGEFLAQMREFFASRLDKRGEV